MTNDLQTVLKETKDSDLLESVAKTEGNATRTGGNGANISVKMGRFNGLILYEVADHELDLLEKGSPSSIYLNFAIFCLSTGLSFTINILSLDIQSIKDIYSIFGIFYDRDTCRINSYFSLV